MSNEIARYSEETFESIKHVNEYGNEFWYARELQSILEYTEWRNFQKLIEKAQTACENSGIAVDECFVEVNKTSPMPNGGVKLIDDYILSRYACYLIVMNGDPRKEVIAVGQTYFAVKTRQQELIDHYDELSEDQKRLAIRKEMKVHNKSLAEAAQKAGVIKSYDFAIFQNYGYQGLYGGLGAKEIHARKGLKENEQILDHMGSTELLLTCSALRRQTKSCAARTFGARKRPIKPTTRSAGRSDRPSPSWAAPCRKTCRRRKRASGRLRASRRSASTANEPE